MPPFGVSPLFGRRPLRAAALVLQTGSACSGPSVVPPPVSACLVTPAPGVVPLDSVRVVVADSALAGRFVRRGDPGSLPDCTGGTRPMASSSEGGPAIRVVDLGPDADPRDPLDRGDADLLVSRDARFAAYARSLPGFRVIPLPWDLTYVLVAGGHGDPPPDLDRSALARDAVRGDARGATEPFWWLAPTACAGGATGLSVGSAIRFAGRDPVARALAERLVALAAMPVPPGWLGALVPASSRTGLKIAPATTADPDGAVMVVAYPRIAPARCDSIRWRAGAIPLIDSRAFVVARSTVPAFLLLGDGSILFLPTSRR